jgi:tetratricopeptide (TPR) repeat protein
VRALPVEQIAARLRDDFRLLAEGSRTALPRQQTLRATIEWSHALLTESEQVVFRRLAVFAGGWTLEAVEAVVAADGLDRVEVVELLARLVDRSLVQVAETGASGSARYRLLETVRQYAWERLRAAGEEPAVRDRHRDWYLALAEPAEPGVRGPSQIAWLDRLEVEHDNLRAALAWCLDSAPEAGLRLAVSLRDFWHVRHHLSEGQRWLVTLLARVPERTRLRLAALLAVATLEYDDPNMEQALFEEGLILAREIEDKPLIVEALRGLGQHRLSQGDYRQARLLWEEALALARQIGDRRGLIPLGWLALRQTDFQQARALLEEGLARERETGDSLMTAFALRQLGTLALFEGDVARAQAVLEESLAVSQAVGAHLNVARARVNLGNVAYWQADLERAREWYETGLVLARELEDVEEIARGSMCLGRVITQTGDPAGAMGLLRDGLAGFSSLNNKWGMGMALHALGLAATRQGDLAQAAAWFQQGLAIRHELGERSGLPECLEGLATVAIGQARPDRAARLLAAAQALRASIGVPLPPVDRPAVEAAVQAARAALGDAAYDAAWSAWQALSLDEVVAEALAEPEV